ncbi:PAAR domain-containing protein [Anabaena azotica FACHB-119]|uniref:PAAR domain-containing protein n=2 Tax=Anabaena azotica TaxID=197653 RepID=A0ABR8DBG5_9NOST|nr:PAAR domain-containing protein [Anabaena azotica FACHB-119]
MGQPAAKKSDQIIAIDTHIVMVPSPTGTVPTPLPHPFTGVINSNLSNNVNIMGRPAATVDSKADNTPAHSPTPPGTSFQKPPTNQATIKMGSPTVKINGKMAARNGDIAQTCNDPADLPVGKVVAVGTVFIG